jgi:hypothetical protein
MLVDFGRDGELCQDENVVFLGFLLVWSSKTPRIQFHFVLKVWCPRLFRSSLAAIRPRNHFGGGYR